MSIDQRPEGKLGGRPDGAPHKAGAFDIRNIVAALLGFYGIVLVIMGIVANSAQQRAKTGDLNANLWAGIAMAVVAAAFVVWSRLRPVIIDERSSGPTGSD
jgi:drug/metabolite transporter (DMT)-like permease